MGDFYAMPEYSIWNIPRGTAAAWTSANANARRSGMTGGLPLRGCPGIRSPAPWASTRKILIGFSQGGYLSYRLVKAHPTLFDAAILLSPSFMGEEQAALDSVT